MKSPESIVFLFFSFVLSYQNRIVFEKDTYRNLKGKKCKNLHFLLLLNP